MEAERERFEEAAFGKYFLSCLVRNPDPRPRISGALDFVVQDCKDKDEFLKKRPDGSYEADTLNSAWWAWQERAKEASIKDPEAAQNGGRNVAG